MLMNKFEFIKDCSLSELIQAKSMIEEALSHLRETAKNDFLDEIREKSIALGLTSDDLTQALQERKPNKAPPKYRNPLNSQETWTGRGRKPKWLALQLEEGKTLAEFTI